MPLRIDMRRAAQIAVLAIAALALGSALVLGDGTASASAVLDHSTRSVDVLSPSQTSENWSGYAVTSSTSTAVNYTSATGTWTVPTATCDPSDSNSASAVWVGIGGYSSTSQALEQTGTEADCNGPSAPTYYAWYELVPAAGVTLKAKVQPGDIMTASVNILPATGSASTRVELQIKNRTRNWTVTKIATPSAIDTSSAEWIAEAPSNCAGFCRALPLANFGSVTIAKAAAIGDGQGGTLNNPAWTTFPIQLVPTSRHARFATVGSNGSTAGAAPGAISADGRSFGVSWLANSTASASQ